MPDPHDDGREYERESAGPPRWVKIAGIVLAVVVLLVIVAMLVSGGHSPRRHGLGFLCGQSTVEVSGDPAQ